jgi:hypothetical protein
MPTAPSCWLESADFRRPSHRRDRASEPSPPLGAVTSGPHAEVHGRQWDSQLTEEHIGHRVVVVLTGVDDPEPGRPLRLKCAHDGSQLHEVGPRPCHEIHERFDTLTQDAYRVAWAGKRPLAATAQKRDLACDRASENPLTRASNSVLSASGGKPIRLRAIGSSPGRQSPSWVLRPHE